MPTTKESIIGAFPLIATEVSFTRHSIIYTVENKHEGVVVCHNSIADKDLVLKPTIITPSNNKVVFVCMYVTTGYYQDIMNGSVHNIEELLVDLNNIYQVGEVVGFVKPF